MTNISDITAALFQGGAYYGAEDERSNLSLTSGTPLSFDGTQAFRNIMFRFPGPASYMTPLDFFLLIDCTGTDPSLYSLKGFVTGEKFYPTIADLRAAFEAGALGMEFDQTLDADWALVDYKPELGVRALEERLAPSTIEIGGKRYKLDTENQYVEYMGWSFYISHSQTLGYMFYDIKFKGERILYELSMQEATAQYGKYSTNALGAKTRADGIQAETNLKLPTLSITTPTTNWVHLWAHSSKGSTALGAQHF
jgi:primary-amine oxidase